MAQRGDELFGPLDPLVRSLPPGTDVFALLRRLDPAKQHRVAAAFPDPIDREVGKALTEIAEGKRITARRRLAKVLSEQPRHVEARAALLRLSQLRPRRGRRSREAARAPAERPRTRLVGGMGEPRWRSAARARGISRGDSTDASDRRRGDTPAYPGAVGEPRPAARAGGRRTRRGKPRRSAPPRRSALARRGLCRRTGLRGCAGGDRAGRGAIESKVRSSQTLLRRARRLAQAVPDDDVELRRLRADTLRRLGV